MKYPGINVVKRLVGLLMLTAFLTTLNAQDGLNKRPLVPIDANCNGYLEYLPIGYTGGTSKYPLLIYITGIGTTGDGSSAQLENMFTGGGFPHEQARFGNWPDAFSINGQTFQFLVITPQFVAPMWNHIPTPDELNDVINYTLQHYRVDTSRIYLAGSSQGAATVWDYPGAKSAYANRIAAILPFSGPEWPTQEKADIIKNARVAVWAFHNLNDDLVPEYLTENFVDFYNNPPTPAIPAKKTIFNATGHLSWYAPLERTWTDNGLNVYQWLLEYQRTPTTAFAGEDQEIVIPANTVQLAGSGTAANGTAISYSWQKISGPPGGTFSSTTVSNPTVSNLLQGTYTFRLTITGTNSSTASDEVAITVQPGAQRIEAENYTNSFDIVVTSTTDDPNGKKVDAIDYTDWMDYTVNVPTADTYRFRFRAGSFYGGTGFQVLNSTGGVLATITMIGTGGWDNYLNFYANIPLHAGTQTIRIQGLNAVPSNVWYLNWFEVINNTQAAQSPLPVNFTLFNASCSNSFVNLLWETSSEVNSKNFSVEKSQNGREWSSIGNVPAAGFSSTEQTYTFKDRSGILGNLYRIAEEDIDANRTLSPVIKSNCNDEKVFAVYPNPVEDRALVNISLVQNSKLNFSVIDSKGAVVKRQENFLPSGISQIGVDMRGLPKGTYTLLARWDKERKSIVLVKN